MHHLGRRNPFLYPPQSRSRRRSNPHGAESRSAEAVHAAARGDLLLIGRNKYAVFERLSDHAVLVYPHPSAYQRVLHLCVPDPQLDEAVVRPVRGSARQGGAPLTRGPVRSGLVRVAL